MSLRHIVTSLLGAPTTERENELLTAASTTAQRLFKQSPDRVAFVLINLGTSDIYLAPDDNVSSTRGIRLAANGGGLTMDVREDFTLPGREWYVIAASATPELYNLQLILSGPPVHSSPPPLSLSPL